MACLTQQQSRKRAEDLSHMRMLAKAFSKTMECDVIIIKTGKEYKFYEVGTEKKEGEPIEYICCQK